MSEHTFIKKARNEQQTPREGTCNKKEKIIFSFFFTKDDDTKINTKEDAVTKKIAA